MEKDELHLKKENGDISGEKCEFVFVHKRKKGKYGRFLNSVSIYKLVKYVTYC